MVSWNERPNEIANLINPAFCSIILFDAINAYYTIKKKGMPYAISFIILPIILHKRTRDKLPATSRSKYYAWIQQNPEVKIDFNIRTKNLVPYTKEAIQYGIINLLFSIDENGEFIPKRFKEKEKPWLQTNEPLICREKASFLGKWLTQSEDVSTIYSLWGIRP